jgi:hypothetical protein
MPGESKMFVQNNGFTETFTDINGKKNNNKMDWGVKYDGNEANIDVLTDDNGRRRKMHMNMSNDDIMRLLEMNAVKMPLDDRLKNDFLTNDFLTNKFVKRNAAVPLFLSKSKMPALKTKKNKKKNIKKSKSKSKSKKRSKTNKNPFRKLLGKLL